MKLLQISTNSWGFQIEILWKPYKNACGFHSFFIGIALVVQYDSLFRRNGGSDIAWLFNWAIEDYGDETLIRKLNSNPLL